MNTTTIAYGASDDANSLTGAYDLLFDRNYGLPGLFEESGSAAARYRVGDLLSVLEHNLADVHRTWERGELVRRFFAPKGVTEKKL